MPNPNIFSDLKVLELASVLAGPSVGQFFAELGAEVIKVENPKTNGDVTRSWKAKGEQTNDVSAYFSCANWGKYSLVLDYSKTDGLKVLYELVKQADVVIASFKPGDAEKLQVNYESLIKVNPEILYGSITGYGANDDRVGYDAVIQAESGFMSINGESDSQPLKLPVALMDILAGHHLKEALLIAYIERLKTGKGQHVTVSLIDAAMASLANQATNWLVGKSEPKQSGSLHPNIAPYGEVFTTKDQKQVILAVGTDKQFNLLCDELGIDNQEQFESNEKRVKNRRNLFEILQAEISQLTTDQLMQKLNNKKIPGGVVNSVSEAIHKYNRLQIDGQSISGLRTFAASLGKHTKISHFLPPPQYGQHTIKILKEKLGLDEQEIAYLGKLGLID